MWLSRFVRDENGATAMEYGLMVSLISIAMMSALIVLGETLESNFTTIENEFAKSSTSP